MLLRQVPLPTCCSDPPTQLSSALALQAKIALRYMLVFCVGRDSRVARNSKLGTAQASLLAHVQPQERP